MKKILIIGLLISTLFLTGCIKTCVTQETYDSDAPMRPSDVEHRLNIGDNCSNFCESKNGTCYSYEEKGCSILADETIFKCLSLNGEMKIYLPVKSVDKP